MPDITFITGNQNKADLLAKYLGFPVKHLKVDLDEIQSLDLKEVVEHKVRQAFAKVGGPVIVEDVALEFAAFGRLPGPFIRFFVDEVPLDIVASMVNGKSRLAVARCVFGYYDGQTLELFEGHINGEVAQAPSGEGGFGWDKIFIPEGYSVTKASLNEEDYGKVQIQIRPYVKLKEFLVSRE